MTVGDFVKQKSQLKTVKIIKNIPEKAKGLNSLKANFDDPIEAFNDYK